MNKLLKTILLVLGIGMVGYALYFKVARIQSPKSTVENNLANAARYGPTELSKEFGLFMDSMSAGWNPVIVAGLAIVLVSAAIKNPTKP